jgi:hypothetical protein
MVNPFVVLLVFGLTRALERHDLVNEFLGDLDPPI